MSTKHYNPPSEKRKEELGNLVKEKKPRLEDLVEYGISLRDMAYLLGWNSRQRVNMNMRRYHMHDYWLIKRDETKQEEKDRKYQKRALIEQFYSLLFLKRQKMAKEEGWAIEQVVNSTMKPRCDLRYIKHFEDNRRAALAYEEIINKGEKPKLVNLTEQSGLRFPSVTWRRLNYVFDGELQCPKRKRRTYTPELKEIIRRAYPLDMTCDDISHMIKIAYNEEVTKPVVVSELHKIGNREPTIRANIRGLKPGSGKICVPLYKEASEMYEALHLGFNEPELPELLNLHPEAVQFAIENMEHIKRNILKALDTIRPEQKHIYPFRI